MGVPQRFDARPGFHHLFDAIEAAELASFGGIGPGGHHERCGQTIRLRLGRRAGRSALGRPDGARRGRPEPGPGRRRRRGRSPAPTTRRARSSSSACPLGPATSCSRPIRSAPPWRWRSCGRARGDRAGNGRGSQHRPWSHGESMPTQTSVALSLLNSYDPGRGSAVLPARNALAAIGLRAGPGREWPVQPTGAARGRPMRREPRFPAVGKTPGRECIDACECRRLEGLRRAAQGTNTRPSCFRRRRLATSTAGSAARPKARSTRFSIGCPTSSSSMRSISKPAGPRCSTRNPTRPKPSTCRARSRCRCR